MLIVYLTFLFFALHNDSKNRHRGYDVVFIACFVLALMAGFRGITNWPDTLTYAHSFEAYTPSLFNYYSMDGSKTCYSEQGFYILSAIIKTFTSDGQTYLLIISCITMAILYKVFRLYAPFPLLGVCAYIARFYIGRNFIQIRAGIAVAILMFCIRYATKRDWKKFFLIVFIASLFHRTALTAIPLYFLCMMKIKKYHVVLIIALAFILASFFAPVIQMFVTDSSTDLNITTYTKGEEITAAKGLRNPLIYFQCFILFIYTFGESWLKSHIYDYFTIRNAYTISTFALITFSMFYGIPGRTATIFATMEFVIIPSLVMLIGKKYRSLAFALMGSVLATILFMNLDPKYMWGFGF